MKVCIDVNEYKALVEAVCNYITIVSDDEEFMGANGNYVLFLEEVLVGLAQKRNDG